jgi:metacaspase-1
MTTRFGLCIGVGELDTNFYGAWRDPYADGPVVDALEVAQILKSTGMLVRSLANATRDQMVHSFRDAAAKSQPGNLFVVYFAGHGGQVEGVSYRESEIGPPALNVICAADTFIHDLELAAEWANFHPEVKLVVVIDCCHSATAMHPFRSEFDADGRKARRELLGDCPPEAVSIRALPDEIIAQIWHRNQSVLEDRQRQVAEVLRPGHMTGSLLSLAACGDNEVALATYGRGLFTKVLVRQWHQNMDARRSYSHFATEIRCALRGARQTPELRSYGTPNLDFRDRTPVFNGNV